MKHPTLLLLSFLSLTSITTQAQKNLIDNGSFEKELNGWSLNDNFKTTPWVVKSGKAALVVSVLNNTNWVGIDQTSNLPKKSEALDVSAWISSTNIVKGKNDWNTGVIIIEFSKGLQKLNSVTISSIEGDHDWEKVEKKIPIPEGANSMRMMIAMSECSGTLSVDDINVHVVTFDEAGIDVKNPDVKLVPDATASAAEAEVKSKLADKNASNATAALFYNLKKSAKTKILFGHQDDTKHGITDSSTDWANEQQNVGISRKMSDVKAVTNAYPAVYGFDFSRMTDYEAGNNWFTYEQNIARELTIDAYNRGGVITYCWHYGNPVSKKGFYWSESPVEAVSQILPGGKFNDAYNKDLLEIAAYSKTLIGKDGRLIPVIFRPFHEFDGDWFWWGKSHCTPEQYKALYQYTVSYLKDNLGVHNFLYAWSPDKNFNTEAEYLERYPGDEFVDMVGIDNYGDMEQKVDVTVAANKFKIVSDVAQKRNKLAALTETGLQNLPQADWYTEKLLKSLQVQPLEFSYVLLWANTKKAFWTPYKGHPAEADFLKFKNDPYVIFGDKLPALYSIAP